MFWLLLILLISLGFYFKFISAQSKHKNQSKYGHEKIFSKRDIKVVKHFNKPLPNYVVIDIETTGLHPSRDEIIQIAAVRYVDHEEVASFCSYIRPNCKIPKEASAINGITDYMVKAAPTISEIKDEFLSFICAEASAIVGYNINFDLRFLRENYGSAFAQNVEIIDVLPLVREAIPGLSNYKLEQLAPAIGYRGQSHNAISDCRATAAVLKFLSEPAEGCTKTPELTTSQKEQVVVQKYQQESDDFYVQQKALHMEAMEKKRIARSHGPSKDELKALSRKMVGTDNSYTSEILRILFVHGCDTSKINVESRREGTALRHNWFDFFFVKTSGYLKYIVLPFAPEEIICDYICTPSSSAEGDYNTRIYIDSPNALKTLEIYIVQAFKKSLPSA